MKKYLNDLQENEALLIKLLIITGIVKLIYLALIPITPQEAYYWYYSRYPDLSYFDHPPVAAYSILIGTLIFGSTSLGIKFMAVVWWFATNILLYKTASDFLSMNDKYSERKYIPLVSVLLYNMSVFGNLYSITLVPDTPLLFFWLLIIYSIQRVFKTGKNIWWIIAGISFGFALMSKYSAIIITGSVFLYLVFSDKHRRYLITPYPYVSILVGLMVFSPVIYWNYSHEWASFKFQFSERAQKAKPLQIKYFLQLIFSQLFLLTPLLFAWFIGSAKNYMKFWKENRLMDYLIFTGLPIIIIFTLVSFKTLVKMNWLLPGYLCLVIITAVYYGKRFLYPGRWTKIGIYFSIFLVLLGYTIQIVPNVPLGQGNTWSGWSNASEKIFAIQQSKGGKDKTFIFGNSYKSAALLKFHLPDQQDTYAENIFGERALQFDYWSDVNSLKGKDAIYVFDNRREYKSNLKVVEEYFDNVEQIEIFEYSFFGFARTRTITAYFCENYHGVNR